MSRFASLALATLLGVIGSHEASCQDAWVLDSEYNRFHVVVSPEASPSEHRAAEVFRDYWERCTGFQPSTGAEPIRDCVNVWIGRVDNPFAEALDPESLGDDGLHLRTIDQSWKKRIRDRFQVHRSLHYQPRRHLVIVGGQARGTLYGVYEFFERYMGVRWLTPEVTHIPPPPASLPVIDFRFVPPLPYREVYYRAFIQNPEYAVAHKQNGNSMGAIPAEWGGNLGFAGGFGHTFYSLVNPDEYWETHPEYFSEVGGQRQRKSQLCLSNPEVMRLATESVRAILRANPPNRRIVSVTQMDWPFWCECANCRAIEELEESHAGPLIHFVNGIAEAIEAEFPDAYVDTFAYTYTRKAPKHVKPRENVIVRLCSIECDFSKTLDDPSSPDNQSFHDDIDAWSAIAPNLYIWDYTQNWWSHQGPHPNFHVFQPNVKFFVDHGVAGLFEQSSATSPHSDYEYLKGYILGHAVWNPEVDWRALYDEFVSLYYREAGPYIRSYHELITQKVLKDNYYLGIFTHMEWMDAPTIAAAEALFRDAFAAAQSDEIRERLKYAYLPVQYAALTAPPEIEELDDTLVLRRPPSQTFDEYWAMIMAYGVTHIGDEGIEAFRERLGAKTPPRHEEVALIKMSNQRYEVWAVPAWTGSVVRLYDKSTGFEVFRRFSNWGRDEGSFQDWTASDPAAPVMEKALAEQYELVERSERRVVMRAVTADGLEVTRTLELDDSDGPLAVELTLRNTGTELLPPHVKLHPEMSTHGEERPEIWVKRGGTWSPTDMTWLYDGSVASGKIPPAGATHWAMYLPHAKVGVVNEVRAEDLDSLRYYCSRERDFLNLEATPLTTPLAPGASRSMRVSYGVAAGAPGQWE